MRPSGEACAATARCEKLRRGRLRSVCGRQGGLDLRGVREKRARAKAAISVCWEWG